MPAPATAISDRDRVLEAADLIAVVGDVVALRQKGREHIGLCPFHEDHRPSFAVVTHKGVAFYKCHSCGAGGNAIDFMINHHRMGFREALEALAKRFGVPLTGAGATGGSMAPLRRALELGAEMYAAILKSHDGDEARLAIKERRISPAMVERFRLGASCRAEPMAAMVRRRIESERDAGRPLSEAEFVTAGILQERNGEVRGAYPGRLVFPILNESGDAIAFGARQLGGDSGPKYLNSPESALFHKSRTLYGIHAARRAILDSKEAVITEGYTDVIACHQAGIENVVATLGTALTADHARILSRLASRVVLLFDGDEAGRRAAERAVPVCFREKVDILIASIEGGKDPDELLRQPNGALLLRQAIASARPALDVAIEAVRDRLAAASGTTARQLVIEDLVRTLVDWGLLEAEEIRRELLIDELARVTGLARETLVHALRQRAGAGAGKANGLAAGPGGSRAASGTGARSAASPPAARGRARGRQLAEESLVAAVLAEPGRCLRSFVAPDGESGTLAELLAPTALQDRALGAIYGAVLERVESGCQPRADFIQADLEDAELQRQVIALAETGARRAEALAESGEKSDLVASELHTLLVLIEEESRGGGGEGDLTVAAVQAQIEVLRSAGHRPTAIGSTRPTSESH